MKYGLVVIGYNRLHGIERLTRSLLESNYFDDEVDLIFSIDNSGKNEIADFANNFAWPFGKKVVRTFEERQGLKKHILSCGVFLKDYDAIAVFEDDIVVSPSFYSFMREAVPYYMNDNNIAGISLYSHKYNVNANLPFIADIDGNDVFFMQFAQSWGQVWMKSSFLQFIEWAEKNRDIEFDDRTSPYVNSWPKKSSWLRLHIKYCVDNNKFFVYPHDSLTTCFSDVGEHMLSKSNMMQVPLVNCSNANNFKFIPFKESTIKYDAYFERIIDDKDVLVDLYGEKKKLYPLYKKVLSPHQLDRAIISSYSLELRPHENNYLSNISGDDIYLYDMTIKTKRKTVWCLDSVRKEYIRIDYYHQFQQHFTCIRKLLFLKALFLFLRKHRKRKKR